jgi:hypothetical protein
MIAPNLSESREVGIATNDVYVTVAIRWLHVAWFGVVVPSVLLIWYLSRKSTCISAFHTTLSFTVEARAPITALLGLGRYG